MVGCYHTLMTSITFQIPLKAVSVNQSHKMAISKWKNPKTGKQRIFRKKNDDYETFEKLAHYYLHKIKDELNIFVQSYDPTQKALNFEVFFYVPQDDYFTKAKSKKNPRIEISRNSLDLDNCLKVTIDTLFNLMGINDKNISDIHAKKIPTDSKTHSMIIRMTYASFPVLNEIFADDLTNL